MATLVFPYPTFTSGTAISSTQVIANFNAAATLLNSTKLMADNIQDSAITAALIASNAVTGAKLNSNVVDDSTLQYSSSQLSVKALGVGTSQLAASAVTTAKINDAAVTTDKINDLAVTTGKINAGAVTLAKSAVRTVTTDGSDPGAGGISISASSGTFSTTSSSLTNVTNLSCTLTTTGKLVVLKLVSDGSGNDAYVGADSGVADALCRVQFKQDSTAIYNVKTDMAVSSGVTGILLPASAFRHEYVPAAGQYAYTVQICQTGGSHAYAQRCKLMAYEEY